MDTVECNDHGQQSKTDTAPLAKLYLCTKRSNRTCWLESHTQLAILILRVLSLSFLTFPYPR